MGDGRPIAVGGDAVGRPAGVGRTDGLELADELVLLDELGVADSIGVGLEAERGSDDAIAGAGDDSVAAGLEPADSLAGDSDPTAPPPR